MKKREQTAVIILVVLILIAVAGFLLFYTKNCKNEKCFNSALEKCTKAKYISEVDEASWMYKINGKKDKECEVYVKLLQLKKGDINIASLEGKDMKCYLPLKVVDKPDKNIERCHGLLKEEMLKIMINNAHKYIMDNLGKIGEELKKVV